MLRRVLLLSVLAALLLAGCAQRSEEEAAEAPIALTASPARMDWSPGTWWSYHAEIQGVPLDVTIVVSERTETGYVLGTNLTSGFFGLPWNGNVTLDRNPVLGDEVWPLFAPPLEHGKTWSYRVRGYDATTTATRASVAGPHGDLEGFAMVARSWGQTFARYDYAPELGWFRHLELVEPTNGQVLLEATLVAYGDRYVDDFYVERALRVVTIDYPTLPGATDVRIPAGALEIHATLTAASDAGVVRARLLDSTGAPIAQAQTLARGSDTDSAASRRDGELRWRLEHTGAGAGRITLEITGVFPSSLAPR